MNGNRRTGPDPVLREQLAWLAPPPDERETPASRHDTVRELLMQELRTHPPTNQPGWKWQSEVAPLWRSVWPHLWVCRGVDTPIVAT
jgi:hypothetical protein